MTQEEKSLLLKDLCARLPYGVICYYNCVTSYDDMVICKANCRGTLEGIVPMSNGNIGFMVGTDKINALQGDIKPYLRPMSSMTEEEKKEYYTFQYKITLQTHEYKELNKETFSEYLDWLNAHHFDYRGLIEKGLALEATEGMYK